MFTADEPITAIVTADDPPPEVDAVVTDVATGQPVLESRVEPDGDGAFRVEWPPLPPSDYRLTVSAADPGSDRLPVHSLFIVAAAVETVAVILVALVTFWSGLVGPARHRTGACLGAPCQ